MDPCKNNDQAFIRRRLMYNLIYKLLVSRTKRNSRPPLVGQVDVCFEKGGRPFFFDHKEGYFSIIQLTGFKLKKQIT
jgi:hypothetical protein